MWARKRPGRWRRWLDCVPAVAATAAGLWLIATLGLFAELGQRPEGRALSLGERWSEATRRSGELASAPLAALSNALREHPAAERVALAASLGVPTLQLSLAPQNEARLRSKRRQALEDGVLVTEEGDFVPGWIEHGDRSLRMRMRLKGDWVDHLRSDSWSLRLKLKDGANLFGMRAFSLHRASTRGGPGELLLLDQMRAAGIIALRSFPVHVVLNGRDLGVMLVEEHFDGVMLAANGRREGVILGFDEDALWRQRRSYLRREEAGDPVPPEHQVEFVTPTSMPVRIFDEDRVWRTPALRAQGETAIGLLRGYIAGTLRAENVFDLRLWARHHCIASAWGAWHGLGSHNLRMYFNPVTRLLEPIAFDNDGGEDLEQSVTWLWADLIRGPAEPTFREACARYLEDTADTFDLLAVVTRERETRELLAALGDRHHAVDVRRLVERLAQLTKLPQPEVEPASFSQHVPTSLEPNQPATALLVAYWTAARGGLLELRNPTGVPITLDSVTHRAGRREQRIPDLHGVVVPPDGLEVTVPWTPAAGGTVRIVAHLQPSPAHRVAHMAQRAAPARRSPLLLAEPLTELAQRPYLDAEDGDLVIRAGRWHVARSIVPEAGVRVRIEPGTQLRFARGARLAVRAALSAQGTADQPIVLTADDDAWAGLVVLGHGDDAVELEHVTIRATNPVARTWSLTGGVTFHRCEVRARACSFEDNLCEDALNIIESRYVLDHCDFAGTPSDAFDGDFSDGQIVGCSFERIGGDAVDLSGSKVQVKGLLARDVTDKALSVGEGSQCTARDLAISNVGTAIASKDGSAVVVHGGHIRGARLAGLMAYVKKAEFGPAEIDARDLRFETGTVVARVQHGSRVTLDGAAQASSALDVERLYAHEMRKTR